MQHRAVAHSAGPTLARRPPCFFGYVHRRNLGNVKQFTETVLGFFGCNLFHKIMLATMAVINNDPFVQFQGNSD